MIKIAITGNIGTGKTTVSKIIKRMRYKVFESDKEVKKILKYKKIITRIKDEFVHINKRLVTNDGHINNTELGNVVFSKKLELQKLEKIIHPEIWKLQDKFLKKNKKEKILFLIYHSYLRRNWMINMIIYFIPMFLLKFKKNEFYRGKI